MVALVDLNKVETILEPSAGYGNLAEAAARAYDIHHYRGFSERESDPFHSEVIDLVEINEKCRAYLKSKNANVIADDFLKLQTFKRYDLIIMNPPFSDGVNHLLKAIEMQKYGGQIVCLLNSETINNPYTLERKVLAEKIKQYDGKVYDYGTCFANSERPTDCWETVENVMAKAQNEGLSQNIEFKYFTVTFYKKGTAHIVFKDMELLKRFNIFAGQREGGLPPSYGKKAYSDMTEREKAIIDEFQGEDDYNEVFLNNDKYIVTGESFLALEMENG